MSAPSPGLSGPSKPSATSGYPLFALALAMTALAYVGTVYFRFVYDDSLQIIQNPALTSWHSVPAFFQVSNWGFLLPDWAGNYYRPIFMCWLLVNRMLWGLNPAPWHVSAVALHLIATSLSFLVARQILDKWPQAAFVALIFGLHPIHIESVAWISGATDSLMAVFVLAAFWAWLRSEQSERKMLWRVLAAALYLLACLSKETALPLPIAIMGYYLVRERGSGLRATLATVWPMYISAAAYLVARAFALHGFVHGTGTPLGWALFSTPVVLGGYLRRLVWPFGLSLFYDTPPVTAISDWRFWVPLSLLIGLGMLAWHYRKRQPLVLFASIWTLLFLAPAIAGLTIFPTGEWIHDRYLYLPSFGLCLWIGYAFGKLRSDRKLFGLPAVSAATAMILAAVLSFATAWQQQYWANALLLYVHAANSAPRSVWAKYYLATELLRRGDKMNAQRLYQAALAIEPSNWKVNVAYGLMLYDEKDYRGADALITRALAGDPTDPNAHFDQGMSRVNYGNYTGGETSFREALRRNPRLPQAHFWLGYCLEQEGRLELARSEYEAEIQLHPDTSTGAEQRLRQLGAR